VAEFLDEFGVDAIDGVTALHAGLARGIARRRILVGGRIGSCPGSAPGKRVPTCSPQFTGVTSGRHDRDVRLSHMPTQGPTDRSANGRTVML
jgi:hypothetical protein